MSGGLPRFTLVTGNAGKRLEAERILGRPVDCAAIDLPEPQSLDFHEVLRRVEKHGDLFADVLTTKQSLTAALKTLR